MAAAAAGSPPPIPSRATKPPSPRTSITTAGGSASGVGPAGTAPPLTANALRLHPAPAINTTGTGSGAKSAHPNPSQPTPKGSTTPNGSGLGSGGTSPASNAIFPYLPTFTHFSFPHSAAGTVRPKSIGTGAGTGTGSASNSQPPSPGGNALTVPPRPPVVVVAAGISRSLPPSRTPSPDLHNRKLALGAATNTMGPGTGAGTGTGTGPRRASLYDDAEDDGSASDDAAEATSAYQRRAMAHATAISEGANVTPTSNGDSSDLWVITPSTPAVVRTGLSTRTPTAGGEASGAEPVVEPAPNNPKHTTPPPPSTATAPPASTHPVQLPLYKPTHSTSNPNTPIANDRLPDWNAQLHVDLIHRQGVRPPPCVAELCTTPFTGSGGGSGTASDSALAMDGSGGGRAYFRLFVPQTRADQKDEFVCCRKKSSQRKFRFSLDPNRLTKKHNPLYIGKMNMKTVPAEPLSQPSAAAANGTSTTPVAAVGVGTGTGTGGAGPTGAGGSVTSPAAPSINSANTTTAHSHSHSHLHDPTSTGEVVHVFTISLRSGTHVVCIWRLCCSLN